MTRITGTCARGLRLPVIRQGDDLVQMTADAVAAVTEREGVRLHDRDVLAVTEAVVARVQGNYATVDHIAEDVRAKFPQGEIGVVFPILSRNRFAIVLRGVARGVKKIYLQLSYPRDEVGNALISEEDVYAAGLNPYRDALTEARYREMFGYPKHRFTGVDYVAYYRQLIEEEGCECQILLSNDPQEILKYTPYVLAADIHNRRHTQTVLRAQGAAFVCGLDGLMNRSIDGCGYNAQYGLLGSNKADEHTVKLFPRDCDRFVADLQQAIYRRCGVKLETMIYGDGAFKDPVGKIWELADPVVCPAHTDGLAGTPNELKLKYLADNDFAALRGDSLTLAIKDRIKQKQENLYGNMASQGTTPRQITDLLGSLCDLVSGSGDKGTPVVLIQGYFDNYATED
ncbi:MAG: coenzyme F420-0:L-glutamate ligase [Firmicutes bacterium]|nr:coenzyme F420-0:L-glutamate ligase [Bacillota bacterium]